MYETQLLPYIGEGITVSSQLALQSVRELGNRRPRAAVLAPSLFGCGYLGTFAFSL